MSRDTSGPAIGDLRAFLTRHVAHDFQTYYGVCDPGYINAVVNNWFDDTRNYDGRWEVISKTASPDARVLDMAAGCGTFLLYGLRNGYDVWGIEPGPWKRQYYRAKARTVDALHDCGERMVAGLGESLPFRSNTFDVVTSWQTVEHVANLAACVREMLRVLKPGGTLYISAPDYHGFYEPHYRVPIFPGMGRPLAAVYIRLLGRPTLGLETIHFITESDILHAVDLSGCSVEIAGSRHARMIQRQNKILARLRRRSLHRTVQRLVGGYYATRHILRALRGFGREEPIVSLRITKVA